MGIDAGQLTLRRSDPADSGDLHSVGIQDLFYLFGFVAEIGTIAVSMQLDVAHFVPGQAGDRLLQGLNAETPVAPGEIKARADFRIPLASINKPLDGSK